MARTILPETTDTERLDTNIYSVIDGKGTEPLDPSFGNTSTKSAGIIKLVNMFIKLLYTLKGTNYLNKEEGTYYLNLFHFNVQDEIVALAKVQDAIDDASEQIISIQAVQGVPATEKLREVTITALDISSDRVLNIELTLEVVSGTSTPIQLPSTTLENS